MSDNTSLDWRRERPLRLSRFLHAFLLCSITACASVTSRDDAAAPVDASSVIDASQQEASMPGVDSGEDGQALPWRLLLLENPTQHYQIADFAAYESVLPSNHRIVEAGSCRYEAVARPIPARLDAFLVDDFGPSQLTRDNNIDFSFLVARSGLQEWLLGQTFEFRGSLFTGTTYSLHASLPTVSPTGITFDGILADLHPVGTQTYNHQVGIDAPIGWSPFPGSFGVIFLPLTNTGPEFPGFWPSLRCVFDGQAGAGTVPWAALSEISLLSGDGTTGLQIGIAAGSLLSTPERIGAWEGRVDSLWAPVLMLMAFYR